MADYDLPQQLYPQVASFGLQKSGLQHSSPFNGTLQAIDFVAERWMLELTTAPRVKGKAGQAEAFFNRLVGGVNRLRMHHPSRLVPVGTLRGATTLNASLSRGNSQLVIAGATSWPNVLRFTDLFDNAYWAKARATVTPEAMVAPDGVASSNQFSFPNELDNAYWSKGRTTVTANATTAPDGTATADKIVETTETGAHHVNRAGLAYVQGVQYTLSTYLKSAERTEAAVQIGNGTAFSVNPSIRVNLTTGAVLASSASVTASSVTSAGNGWWRISVSGIATTTASDSAFICFIAVAGSTSYTGDGTSGVYAWGAEFTTGFAEKLVETTETGAHHISRQNVPFQAGTTYTLSSYIKAAERTEAVVGLGNGVAFAVNPTVRVNLSTGALVGSPSAGVTAYSITNAGNGWWWISVSGIATSTANDTAFPCFISVGGTSSYTGDGVSGVYVWGAQLQLGPLTAYSGRPTLKAGDLLGVTGHLLQVADDAEADPVTWIITANTVNRIRSTVSSGGAVTWDRPTTTFVAPAMRADAVHRPGHIEGMTISLMEKW